MSDESSAAIAAVRKDWKTEHMEMYISSGGTQGHIMDITPVGGPVLGTHCMIRFKGRKSGKTMITALGSADDADSPRILLERAGIAEQAGIEKAKIWIDPGIGFGKTPQHNFALLAATDRLVETGYRVLVGPSRKRFIGSIDGSGETERVGGTIAACLSAARQGAAAVRVHDVAPVAQALAIEREISAASEADGPAAR